MFTKLSFERSGFSTLATTNIHATTNIVAAWSRSHVAPIHAAIRSWVRLLVESRLAIAALAGHKVAALSRHLRLLVNPRTDARDTARTGRRVHGKARCVRSFHA